MSRITKLFGAVAVVMRCSYASPDPAVKVGPLPFSAAFHYFVDARHGGRVDTGTVDAREMRLVRRHIDALRRVSGRHLLVVQRRGLLPHIAQVLLKPVDPFLALEGLAVAGDDVDEV